MNTGQQNIFNQQQLQITPGRFITKVKRYVSPSGQVVELRWVTITVQDGPGRWRTEEITEVVPPLRDGCVVNEKNFDNLQECVICLGITVQAYQCPKCHQWVCMVCAEKVKGQSEDVCINCAWKIKYPNLSKIHNLIWGY